MNQYTELEELEAVIATQDLIAFENAASISEYLEDKPDDKSSRFKEPVTTNEIEQREKDRIPKKTRQSTAWSVNVYRAWATHRNDQIDTLQDDYPSVPVDFKTSTAEEINYWMTRFILEVMRSDGKPYPANTLYNISAGLLRHFRDDLNRYDLNILSKDDAHFQSFRKALDSRMKEMTIAGIGTKKTSADPLTVDDEEQLWSTGTIGFHSAKALSYAVFFYNCKVFGFRAMNEHVSLMAEQYEMGADKDGEFITFNGRVSKNVQGGLQQRKVEVKTIKQYAQPLNRQCVVRLFREYLSCIPSTGRFYRKPLASTEPGDVRYGVHPVGINTLSKYLQSICKEAKINMEGKRFTNHSGKVTCATQLYESGTFDEQTIMSRTGHRSTDVRAYKRPSSTLVKAVSDTLQPPAPASEEPSEKTSGEPAEKASGEPAEKAKRPDTST